MKKLYLIWSHEHSGWWAPEARGYTRSLDAAGRYDRGEALEICRNALPGARGRGPTVPNEIPVALQDLIDSGIVEALT